MPSPAMMALLGAHAAAGSGGFDPASITGLVGWYDASAITGLSDTDPVGTWEDGSSAANDAVQAIAAGMPTYRTNIQNGLPAVSFDGGDSLICAVDPGANDFTVFAVIDPGGTGDRTVIGATVANRLQWRVQGSSGKMQVLLQGSSNRGVSTSVVPVGFSLVSIVSTGAFYLNGAADGSWTTVSFTADAQTYIGRQATGEYFNGYIAELLKYHAVLSTTDREAVDTYLANKWGL